MMPENSDAESKLGPTEILFGELRVDLKELMDRRGGHLFISAVALPDYKDDGLNQYKFILDQWVEIIKTFLENHPNITGVELGDCVITKEAMAKLLQVTTVTKWCLDDASITEEAAELFCTTSHVSHLRLTVNPKIVPLLSRISVSDIEIGFLDGWGDRIAEALSKNPMVKSVTFAPEDYDSRLVCLTSKGVQCYAAMPALTSLDINSNGGCVDVPAASALAKAAALKKLIIYCGCLGSSDAFAMLATSTSLKTIDVSHSGLSLSDAGMLVAFQIFKKNAVLERLTLDINGPISIEAINALIAIPTLTTLALRGYGQFDFSVTLALAQSETLMDLDLSNNEMDDDNLIALSSCKSLRRLIIENINTQNGISHLGLKALTELPRLEALKIGPIGSAEDLRKVMPLFKKQPYLVGLDIRGFEAKDTDTDEVKAKIEKENEKIKGLVQIVVATQKTNLRAPIYQEVKAALERGNGIDARDLVKLALDYLCELTPEESAIVKKIKKATQAAYKTSAVAGPKFWSDNSAPPAKKVKREPANTIEAQNQETKETKETKDQALSGPAICRRG